DGSGFEAFNRLKASALFGDGDVLCRVGAVQGLSCSDTWRGTPPANPLPCMRVAWTGAVLGLNTAFSAGGSARWGTGTVNLYRRKPGSTATAISTTAARRSPPTIHSLRLDAPATVDVDTLAGAVAALACSGGLVCAAGCWSV